MQDRRFLREKFPSAIADAAKRCRISSPIRRALHHTMIMYLAMQFKTVRMNREYPGISYHGLKPWSGLSGLSPQKIEWYNKNSARHRTPCASRTEMTSGRLRPSLLSCPRPFRPCSPCENPEGINTMILTRQVMSDMEYAACQGGLDHHGKRAAIPESCT